MLKNFHIIGDNRGSLISIESKIDIPFEIKRVYYIFGNKNNVRRGFHAHKNLQQVLIAVSGSCKILLDSGQNREEILLDSPKKGLLIKNFMWREMFDFSADCVLLVLASEHYDEKDYIRDYNQFLNTI
jgi:dTDP-4-dehydrorhamnose 3,5-epimerase-like enzyme